MKVIPSAIPDVLLIEPDVFTDARGFFYESFNQRAFNDATGLDVTFVQDNHSHSTRGVLRGLHYQINHPQGKLVRVTRGAIFDVTVDLRKSSSSFGQSVCDELTEQNRLQKWIPPGFAHGFLVTSEFADVLYKTTDYYAPAHERTLLWNDPDLWIGWPLIDQPIISLKDQDGLTLSAVSGGAPCVIANS